MDALSGSEDKKKHWMEESESVRRIRIYQSDEVGLLNVNKIDLYNFHLPVDGFLQRKRHSGKCPFREGFIKCKKNATHLSPIQLIFWNGSVKIMSDIPDTTV